MSYRVDLPVFSGPLDLLLHLIKQQEVDIHEVKIATILGQYLEHLDILQSLDLADIGDFVVMASTLMEIKSRELLPGETISLDDELDPKDDLIRRLLEYKRYRDLSRRFDRMAKRRNAMLGAGLPLPAELHTSAEDDALLDLGNVEIWALTAAFSKLLEETGGEPVLHVDVERQNVRYYTERILQRVRGRREVAFEELFDRSEGRWALIGVFVAVLEMMKQGFIRARQDDGVGAIVVAFCGPDDLTADGVAVAQEDDAAVEPEEEVEIAALSELEIQGPVADVDAPSVRDN